MPVAALRASTLGFILANRFSGVKFIQTPSGVDGSSFFPSSFETEKPILDNSGWYLGAFGLSLLGLESKASLAQ
ncbi:MAG: hypothetical protein JWN03_1032 [Nocardia sp.]|nr:hypothetical protein [Nocardia sp.]